MQIFQLLESLDRSLFLLINGLHSGGLDHVMASFSGTILWLPFYAYVLYHVFKVHGNQGWIVIGFLVLLIALTDQGSGVIKHAVQRYRPSHNLEIQSLVHIVNGYRGGPFGFVSSHAANCFGAATFLFLTFKNERKWCILFVWAGLVAYSRMYLGVHYPSDIIAGASLGVLLGFGIYYIYQKIRPKRK